MSTTTVEATGLGSLLADYDRLRELRDGLTRVLSQEERLDSIADAASSGGTLPDVQNSPATRAFKVAGVNRALDRIEAEAIDAIAEKRGEASPEDAPDVKAADAAIRKAYDAHAKAMASGEPRERVGELHYAWLSAVEDKRSIVRNRGIRKPVGIDPEHRLTGDQLGEAIEAAFDGDVRRRESVVKRGELLRIHDELQAHTPNRGITGEEQERGDDRTPIEDKILEAQPRLAGISDSEVDALLAEYHGETPTTDEVQ